MADPVLHPGVLAVPQFESAELAADQAVAGVSDERGTGVLRPSTLGLEVVGTHDRRAVQGRLQSGAVTELSRTLTGPLSVEDVLSGMTAAAVELIPAAAEMGVLLITQNRKFETHAATSQHVHHLHVLRERFWGSPVSVISIQQGWCAAGETRKLCSQVGAGETPARGSTAFRFASLL